mmetsp:Transcript_8323/g.12199  ORF Transcript_8323/g.12199 Transcript_8323/m.12199 type:complete len:97 (+) Transcript_8323:94-384(+)
MCLFPACATAASRGLDCNGSRTATGDQHSMQLVVSRVPSGNASIFKQRSATRYCQQSASWATVPAGAKASRLQTATPGAPGAAQPPAAARGGEHRG